MDIFLLIVGFIFCLIGIVGALLPVLPGPFMGWIGILLLYFTSPIDMNYWIIGITLFISILIQVLDYVIPAMGTKKFGGTKYGAYGTTIGLIIGLLVPIPFGFVIGAFVGAFVGEMIHDSKNPNRAGKAAIGSFLGFLASTTLKLIVSVAFTGIFIQQALTNWDNLVN
ncbi:DUF456 domain-containing protein [Namhaeicola litoreus]|uniref:DUF456 domain-containing protein n=1 Tax=Namhaeicola litoreus TaxID=1052145 RepID=A0ABW3Y2E4_9FLAO